MSPARRRSAPIGDCSAASCRISISNAIKYTPSGRVLVGCRRRSGKLSVQVYDTGIGIPASKQQAIFHEFHRLEGGARVARGLGLGLSIVERIGRVLDHPVLVTSVPGNGSMFAVELPTAAPVPEVAAAPVRPAVPASDLAGLSVLCVDNEPRILEGMEALLTGWGCMVSTAAGTREALAGLKDGRPPPDVLLVDYHLDEGTGIDAVTQLRWRLGPNVPAALVTANRSPTLKEEAAQRGLAVLFKPVKPAALRAFLAQQRTTRNAAE